MDSKFPQQLFPTFYYTGPPERSSSCPVEGWGSYGQLLGGDHSLAEEGPEALDLKFRAQHTVKGQRWVPLEPIAAPLLPPNNVDKCTSFFNRPPDAMDFPKHMKNFYLDNPQDAFGTMSSILAEHFYFGSETSNVQAKKTGVCMTKMKHFLSHANYEKCPLTYLGKRARQYRYLLGDTIHDIPPVLLAEFLHEELALQWQQKHFDEVATGGSVGYFQLMSSDTFQEGCLIYPRKAALNSIEFQKVVLKVDNGDSPLLSLQSSPITYKLNGTVRQVSVGRMEESVHVGLRSDYCCGVWVATRTLRPVPKEVIKTENRTTCLTVSPHIPGELVVASESGAAHLWTLGQCLSKFREEEENLYFNAQSQWRWCDFSAHPRVMLYADRTGLELTDIRSKENCSHTLFRIGQTPDCKTGERVMLSKYLFDVNAYHHLVTTQYSAYIMDERFPCLPMVKWDHMMAGPPMFAQVLGRPSQGGSNKVLLGSQHSQEIMLLQYSGGDVLACHSVGPPQKLISLKKSLRYLPGQIPHKKLKVQERLEMPAAGITSIYHTGINECMCVLQLTESGDIFYQFLTPTENEAQSSNNLAEDTQTTAEWSDSLCQSQKQMMDKTVNEEHGTLLLELEPSVIDNEDPASTSDVDICGASETSASQTLLTHSAQESTSVLKSSVEQEKASKEILMKWKSWLNTLHSKQNKKKSRTYKTLHWTLATKGLISLDSAQRDAVENAHIISLRNDMKEVMKTKQVLVHRVTSLPPQEVFPTPDPVDTECWGNDLSQRLSVSWDGHWKSWWEEKLGLNREKKIEELRRKRRRQKHARARSRVSLSGSFTSSVGCLSDLDDFSAASSFGDSQPPDLDTDSICGHLSSQENPFSESENVTSVDVERKSKSEKPNSVQVDSGSAVPVHTRSKTQEARRLNQELYLSTLVSSQEESTEPTEQNSFSFPLSMSSQVSNISMSQKKPSVGPSSLGSIPSRPAKKRSRMGF